ncbi:MAG: cbb3-type cytochrome c oxidase subunit 3 [Pseudomonadota bacterium]
MIDAVREYFHTDWAAMTSTDWFGLVAVVTLTLLMVVLYFWVFSPRNKEKLESHRDFVLKDDLNDGEK